MAIFTFGENSRKHLDTLHPRLQLVCTTALRQGLWDFSIIDGRRTLEEQQALFADGKSTLDGVTKKSRHQSDPAEAMDLLPWPNDLHGVNIWSDPRRFTLFAGWIIGVGRTVGVPLRWGGDWDGDSSFRNQQFHDLPHFELD